MKQIRKILINILLFVVMGQTLVAGDLGEQVRVFDAQIDSVESVEQIDRAVKRLGELSKLIKDSGQRREAEVVKSRYIDLYSKVKIERVSSVIGREEISLILNERAIKTSQQPEIDGGKARNLLFKAGETSYNSYVLTYDYFNCRRGKQSVITMTFNLGNKRLSHTLTFDADNFLPNVEMNGDVTMMGDIFEEDAILGIRIKIPLRLIRCERLKITAIRFLVPGVTGSFGMSNLAEEFELCESCVVPIQFPDRIEIDQDVFNDFNRPSTLLLQGMMNDRVPLNETFDLNVITDW